MFDFNSLDDLIAKGPRFARSDVVALILAEDFFQIDQTIAHHLRMGFDHCIVISRSAMHQGVRAQDAVTTVYHDVFATNAMADVVNRCLPMFDGGWVMVCYNGEFLYFPFCETRSISDVTRFVTQEKRPVIPIVVVDAYPAQMPRAPYDTGYDPTSGDVLIDSIGYHARPRWNMDQGRAHDRQLDMFGGLKWRFSNYVPFERRRIDRVALFQARAGLVMGMIGPVLIRTITPIKGYITTICGQPKYRTARPKHCRKTLRRDPKLNSLLGAIRCNGQANRGNCWIWA